MSKPFLKRIVMPDLITLASKWWKHILAVIIISVVIAAIVMLIKPAKYLGEATALPVTPYAADKQGVFSRNIQILYPPLGTADDLDKILGTAKLDTVYAAVTDQMNLIDYFGEDRMDGEARQKALIRLKRNCKVTRSDYGELKVSVWDRDRNQVAAMANAVMAQLCKMHRDIYNLNNETILKSIQHEYKRIQSEFLQLSDSLTSIHAEGPQQQLMKTRLSALAEQTADYEKLQSEYELMVHTKPEVLVVVEKAVPPVWKDALSPVLVLLGAAFLGLLFGLLLSLIFEKRKTTGF
jgi:uncharacterized protein involved in exopolysaccharide biosynthesis